MKGAERRLSNKIAPRSTEIPRTDHGSHDFLSCRVGFLRSNKPTRGRNAAIEDGSRIEGGLAAPTFVEGSSQVGNLFGSKHS